DLCCTSWLHYICNRDNASKLSCSMFRSRTSPQKFAHYCLESARRRKNSLHIVWNSLDTAKIRSILFGIRSTPQKFAPYCVESARRRKNSLYIVGHPLPIAKLRSTLSFLYKIFTSPNLWYINLQYLLYQILLSENSNKC